jgi:hypothetical protein
MDRRPPPDIAPDASPHLPGVATAVLATISVEALDVSDV